MRWPRGVQAIQQYSWPPTAALANSLDGNHGALSTPPFAMQVLGSTSTPRGTTTDDQRSSRLLPAALVGLVRVLVDVSRVVSEFPLWVVAPELRDIADPSDVVADSSVLMR